MPGCDWIPGLSQLKSAFQLVTGDLDGAAQTQENFTRECPIVAPFRTIAELAAGDTKAAEETLSRCVGTMSNVANSIPVVGHVKGGIHHLVGDHKGGNRALNAATRTTVVLGAGAVAAAATGGFGAIPAGMAAGSTFDLADTLINDKPKGMVATLDNALNDTNAGNVFDTAIGFVGDGMTGYSGGKMGTAYATKTKLARLESELTKTSNQMTDGLGPDGGMTSGQSIALANKMKALDAQINTIKYDTPVNLGKFKGESNPAPTAVTAKTMPILPPVQTTSDNVKGQSNPAATTVTAKPSPVQTTSDSDCSTSKKNKVKEEQLIGEETYIRTDENEAFFADYYEGEKFEGDTKEKRAKAESYKTQESSGKTYAENYSSYKLTTVEEIEQICNNQDRNPNYINLERTCQLNVRLFQSLVQMPAQFNYKCEILTNNPLQGLLHSFFRHFDQWTRFIAIGDILERLEPIRTQLNEINGAMYPRESNRLAYKLDKFIKSLPDGVKLKIRSDLLRVQHKILRFIQENVTYERYLGESINDNDQLQVNFDVGDGQVMVVAVSRELYPLWWLKSVRGIITVYFISKEEFEKRKTTKMFPLLLN